MSEVTLADAESCLSKLVDRVEAGESICITRNGKAVAQLVAVAETPRPRKPIDIEALRKFTEGLPMQTESAGEFVRAMRDSDRY